MRLPSTIRPAVSAVKRLTLGILVASGVAFGADEPTLESRIRPLVDAHQGQVAVAIKRLSDGAAYELNAEEPMPTASLIKVAVMVEAYRQADVRQLDLTKKITLRAEEMVPGSGVLTEHFSPGLELSVRDAVRLMMAFSDNTATNLVLDQIGLGATAATMESLGLPHTKIHSKVYRRDTSLFPERSEKFGLGSTTAREMATLLERLHRGELASPESTAAMLEHLRACESKTLPRFLPAGTRIAHKTGSVNAARTAAGILDDPSGPIVVVVLTNGNDDQSWTDDNAGEALCGRIAAAAYEHFHQPAAGTDAKPETKAEAPR